MKRQRSFLFLQGVCSPFFLHLADSLTKDRHQVYKLNFNTGDWLYWGGRAAWNYRGSVAQLGEFLDEKYRTFDITDQVLFGDCRPVHHIAVERGKISGIRTHVFEEGYFRPSWVTLEREGVNGYSLLPRDPEWFRDVGPRLPTYGDGLPFQSSFAIRAAHDIAYHLAGFWNPLFYSGYRTHAPMNAAVEYYGYARRLPLLRFHRARDQAVVEELLRTAIPFFVLPLQLSTDAQIRTHSRFKDMPAVVEFVMRSFAHFASDEARLVIKNHPLEPGLIKYAKLIRRLATDLDIVNRVVYMETGDLDTMLSHAQGTVTVNSTVGALSLAWNCPTITLGDPIYNIDGLTYQGKLEDFWQDRRRPDLELFKHFRNTIIHTTQVNGGLYSRQGIEMAVENSRHILTQDRSPLEELL